MTSENVIVADDLRGLSQDLHHLFFAASAASGGCWRAQFDFWVIGTAPDFGPQGHRSRPTLETLSAILLQLASRLEPNNLFRFGLQLANLIADFAGRSPAPSTLLAGFLLRTTPLV